MLSHFSHVRLLATLWTVARQAPLSMGFSRQEYWSGLPFLLPRDLPNPGINIFYVSCIGRQVLYHWCHLGSPMAEGWRPTHLGDQMVDNILKMTLSRNSNRLYPQFKLLKQSPPSSSIKISSLSGSIVFGVWLCVLLNMNLFLPTSIKTSAAFGTLGPLLAGLSCARTPSSLESGLLTVIGMLAWHQGQFFFLFIYF